VVDVYRRLCSVTLTLERLREATGLNIVVAMLQFGVMNDELARRNMQRFAVDVMPHLRD
jgi:hypothetical protein